MFRAIALRTFIFSASVAFPIVAFTWTGPTAAPPNNNVSAPVNIGSAGQVKAGDFSTQGKLGAGTVSPSASYQLDVYKAGWKAYFHGTDGGISIGPLNSGWAHIYSDAGNAQPFIFNTDVYTTTNGFSSYDSDLLLKRAGTTKVTIGSSAVTIGGGSSSNWAQLNIPGTPGSVASINAAGSIYSYDKICVGNASGYCNGAGGVVILGTGVKFPDGTTQTTAAGTGVWTSSGTNIYNSNSGNVGIGTANPAYKLDVAGQINAPGASGGYVSSGNYGGTGSAAYFPAGIWSNGSSAWIYGTRYVNGQEYDTAVGTIRDAGGGWIRTYGATGWYSQTYGGGWYMSDATWLRAYGNKSIYTAGQVRGDGGLCIGTDCRTSWPTTSSLAWASITDKPFNWSGQSGQPTWLWGSNDGTNYYVWNPSNFNVNSVGGYTAAGLLKWNTWDNGNYYQTNGDIYMGWAGNWLSTVLSQKLPLSGGTMNSGAVIDNAGRMHVASTENIYLLARGGTTYVSNAWGGAGNLQVSGDIYDGAIGLWVSQLRLSQQLGATYYYGAPSCPGGAIMVGVENGTGYGTVSVTLGTDQGGWAQGQIFYPDIQVTGVYCRNINY